MMIRFYFHINFYANFLFYNSYVKLLNLLLLCWYILNCTISCITWNVIVIQIKHLCTCESHQDLYLCVSSWSNIYVFYIKICVITGFLYIISAITPFWTLQNWSKRKWHTAHSTRRYNLNCLLMDGYVHLLISTLFMKVLRR